MWSFAVTTKVQEKGFQAAAVSSCFNMGVSLAPTLTHLFFLFFFYFPSSLLYLFYGVFFLIYGMLKVPEDFNYISK